MPDRCAYCLDDRVSVSMCVGCRTRLERAEADLRAARDNAEGWRRMYYRLVNQNARSLRKNVRR